MNKIYASILMSLLAACASPQAGDKGQADEAAAGAKQKRPVPAAVPRGEERGLDLIIRPYRVSLDTLKLDAWTRPYELPNDYELLNDEEAVPTTVVGEIITYVLGCAMTSPDTHEKSFQDFQKRLEKAPKFTQNKTEVADVLQAVQLLGAKHANAFAFKSVSGRGSVTQPTDFHSGLWLEDLFRRLAGADSGNIVEMLGVKAFPILAEAYRVEALKLLKYKFELFTQFCEFYKREISNNLKSPEDKTNVEIVWAPTNLRAKKRYIRVKSAQGDGIGFDLKTAVEQLFWHLPNQTMYVGHPLIKFLDLMNNYFVAAKHKIELEARPNEVCPHGACAKKDIYLCIPASDELLEKNFQDINETYYEEIRTYLNDKKFWEALKEKVSPVNYTQTLSFETLGILIDLQKKVKKIQSLENQVNDLTRQVEVIGANRSMEALIAEDLQDDSKPKRKHKPKKKKPSSPPAANASANQEVSYFEGRLAERDEALKKVQAALEAAQKDLEKTQTALEGARRELSAKQEALEGVKPDFDKLTSQFDAQASQLSLLQQNFEDAKAEAAAANVKVHELEALDHEKAIALAQSQVEVNALKAEKAAKDAALAEMQAELAKAHAQIVEAQTPDAKFQQMMVAMQQMMVAMQENTDAQLAAQQQVFMQAMQQMMGQMHEMQQKIGQLTISRGASLGSLAASGTSSPSSNWGSQEGDVAGFTSSSLYPDSIWEENAPTEGWPQSD